MQAKKSANSQPDGNGLSRRQMCYVLSDVPCLRLRFHSNVSVGCYVRRLVNETMKMRRDKGVVDLMIDLVASEKQLNKKLCPKLHPEFVMVFFVKVHSHPAIAISSEIYLRSLIY